MRVIATAAAGSGTFTVTTDSRAGGRRRRRMRRRHHLRRILGVVIATAMIFSLLTALAAPPARAAGINLTVDSVADLPDANVGDGICATSAGTCTLRAAIQEANAQLGADVITLPAGTYPITIVGGEPVEPPEPDPLAPCTQTAADAHQGDHDIVCPVTILGAGAGTTVIDAGELDRVLEVHPASGIVTLSGVTLRNGLTEEDGGGIFSSSTGTLNLNGAVVADSTTVGDGGGIHTAAGSLRINAGSTVSGNTARNGGGIYSAGELSETGVPASVTVTNAAISGNDAIEGGGGGIFSDHEGALTLNGATISENFANDGGGGIAAVSKSSVTITGGVFSGNTSHGDGAGAFTGTERAVTIAGTEFTGNESGVPVAGEAGEGSGGGLASGGDGAVLINGATFADNVTSGEGGGMYLDNNGSVTITNTTVTGNTSQAGGGGIQNAAMSVMLSKVTVTDNRAHLDGGGIESQGSGAFTIVDSSIIGNTAENGGGLSNAADGGLHVKRSTFYDNRAVIGLNDDTGLGGGIYGLGDAEADYENVTISGNLAQVRGGGMYIDSDAGVHVANSTISRNLSPIASGVGGEIGSINFPIQPSTSVLFRNTIVAGNLLGSACTFAIGSEGGNIEDGDTCFFRGPRDRANLDDPALDAVADNGGLTMTMALRPDSYAIDGGVSPCAATDQRGVPRPQNTKCDSGAFEYEGPFPPLDEARPDTAYVSGPIQDTENTSIFTFTGTDNVTATEDLLYECRLIETEVGEPPEPPDPTEPPDPALAFVGCPNPWQVPVIEAGFFTFEVRAIDRAGNVDNSPASHTFNIAEDTTPPDTFFLETPPNPSFSSSAVFTFGATDNMTAEQFMEVECRIDTTEPTAWLECTNPTVFSNLAVGEHTVQVRAADGSDNIDPTPATYTWTVAPPLDCDAANITLGADADVSVDQESPFENFVLSPQLVVRSADLAANARALVRFPVANTAPDCTLESATLRLYAGSSGPDRTLRAVPLAGTWSENGVTWNNQPATTGTPATAPSGDGYRSWDVTDHVAVMLAGSAPNHGWLIRDAVENDPEGEAQAFLSRETPQDPPPVTLPQLVLRFEPAGTPPPPPPPPGDPATVACGDVITESTVVQNDLIGCLGEGLVVGAPDIEIDLDGHRITSGAVLEPGEEDGLLAGIRNAGHANVVIKGGTVENYGYGVRLMGGAKFNVIEDMTLERNAIAGVELFDADDGRNGNTVRNNTFIGNGEGAVALTFDTEGSTVIGNTFIGNGGVAVLLQDAHRNRIEDNDISGLILDPLIDSDGGVFIIGGVGNEIIDNHIADTGDSGVAMSDGAHHNRVERNVVSHTSDSGIAIADSDGAEIVDNIVHISGGAAISVGGNDGIISGNDLRFNPGGIQLNGSNNLVEDNDVSFSSADGISVEGGLGNEIRANTAEHTRATGIAVEVEATDTTGTPVPGNIVAGNSASHNLGDGISVASGGHVVGDNSAHHNAGYGIVAGEFVDDDGGNTASGNAEPEQCVGVVCTTGTPPPAVPPDLTAPNTVMVEAPSSGITSLESQTFTFTGTDNLAPATALRYECRLDAPPDPDPEPPDPPDPGDPPEPPEPPDVDNWLDCGSPMVFELVLAGEHTFEVRAIDPFDNVDLTPATHTWTVVTAPPGADTTPPTTQISDAPSNPSISTTAVFRFRGSDNATPGPLLTFECRLDGTAESDFAPCTSPFTAPGLPLGSHTFDVRAVDLHGNEDASPATHTWIIEEPPPDVTPPDTTIDSHPDPTTVATTATFTFSSDDDDDGVVFECSVDGGAYAPCTSPHTLSGLGVGDHDISVRARDAAGNADPTPATFSWTVTAPPVPTSLSCGMTVTTSILATNNLMDCLGDGLVIGAAGITVDLDGHTIDGTGIGSGIANNGFDAVSIANGVVQEFEFGMALNAGTGQNIVSFMTFQLNSGAGIQLTNADGDGQGTTVRNSTAAGNGAGMLVLAGTQHADIHDNLFAGNAGEGIYLLGSSLNRIAANVISGSSDISVLLESSVDNTVVGNSVLGGSDAGVLLQAGSHRNVVADNTIMESEAGVVVIESNDNEVLDNTAQGNGDAGIVLEAANDGVVRGNDLRFNSGGIELDGSSGNLIEANIASETDGTGIEIGDMSFTNVIRDNEANSNSAGIAVGGGAPGGSGNIIDGNTASNNDGDGIHIGAVGHVIVGNVANNNAGWGIYAALSTPAGVNVDGGGNLASGNTGGGIDPTTGRVIECFNIVCDGGPPLPTDQVPPETSITTAPAATTSFTTATFGFTGSDNATQVTFECSLDGAAFTTCTSPATYSGLAVGPHTFRVRAKDYSQNIDPTPSVHSWDIEPLAPGVPPDTAIESGPDATTAATTATFTMSSNEPGVTFECSLDAAPFEPCPTPVTYTGLPVGAHDFVVRAIDLDDLPDPSPATFAWTITAPPVPTTVSCGQTITQSTRLTNDLVDCAGNGLVVGANAITIDLDGHVIDGLAQNVGILNNGFDSVTIVNGTIQEFDTGIQLGAGSLDNIVSDVTVTLHEVAGVALLDADGAVVRRVSASLNGMGIHVGPGTQGATVHDNTAGANSLGGIVLTGATGTTVSGNTLATNDDGGVIVGIEGTPANGNVVTGNTITSSGGGGVVIHESTGNEIVGNLISLSNGAGVTLEGATGNEVRGNDVRNNPGGIELSDSSGNLIIGNNAGSSSGAGIELAGLSFDNTVTGNQANGNSGEGISVEGVAPTGQGNLIDGNTVNSNSGNGMFIGGSGHTVANNVSNLNDGWGIYVENGNVDGGGNTATGNAEPAQCFGIVCIIGPPIGAPDTEIVLKPADPSTSRNALFTFTGTDDTTAPFDLGFECRLDSTSDLDWVECENPWEYTALSPGSHTFEVRAIDLQEQADPTPATHTWVYTPLAPGVAPDTFIDIAPPLETKLFEGIFTFSSNEPDVTFECALDDGPFSPCEFFYEFALEEFEVGEHTFRVRATDFEGNTDPTPATYTWTILGVIAVITDGPAFIPPEEPGEPAEGGETDETTATFEFEANAADATFECSLDLGPFVACTSPVTYTGLGVGEHLFRIMAFDPETEDGQLEPTEYGWVVLLPVDTEPPDTEITDAPASGTSDTVFTFTGTDDQTQPLALAFECRLDSTVATDWIECVSPFNLLTEFPEFTPGAHVLEVRAVDLAEPEGNVDPTPDSHSWTSVADTTPPETTILTGPPPTTTEIDAELTFTGTDNATPLELLTFECSLDGAAFEECDSPHSVQGLAGGEHTVAVRTVDLAGNADPTPATRTWTVIAPPVTTILTGPAATTTDTTATFTFEADQAGSTFACSLDGGAFLPCVSPLTYTGLGGGGHELEVQATNGAGLVEVDPPTWEWIVDAPPDTTPPDTTIDSGPPATTTSTTASFTFSASEPGATFQCALDGGSFGSCETPHEITGLASGEHTLAVRAVDAAGNIDATPDTHTWEVDGPPVSTITSGPPEETELTSATFTFESSDPGSTFECWLDGPAGPCTSPFAATGLGVGPHIFAVRATDPAGSVELEWVDHEWEIFAPVAPQTAFAVGGTPPASTASTSATFAFTGTDNTSEPAALSFVCSLDGAPATSCASPLELTGLPVGVRSLSVAAIDEAGLVDATPASFTWTVTPPPDTTPPQTTTDSGPPASTSDTTASFTFSSSESGSTFQCSLDGAAFATCTSPQALSGLALGSHTFSVRAIDAAGNVDPTPATSSWTVAPPPDTTPPQTTLGTTPPASTTDTTASFTFSSSESGSTFQCSLDGAAFAACTSPQALSALPVGAHTFSVRALDGAGNIDPSPATHNWTVTALPACTATTITVNTNSDAWVAQSSASSNNGADSNLKVKSQNSNDNFRTAVNFAFPNIASNCQITSATLRINASSATSGRTIQALRFTSAWTENGITWSNQPATAGPAATSSSGTGWRTWNVTTQVQAMYTGNARHGFLVRDATEGNNGSEQQYRARENGQNPAQLVLQIAPIPAPDTTPPQTTLGTTPPATTTDTSASFAFTSSETGSTFQCSLDGAAYATCTTPHTVTGLSVASHTFRVRAIDAAGNVDPTPAEHTWTVQADTTPPQSTIGSAPPATTTATSASFAFTSSEAGSTFQCSLDGAAFAACTSPHAVTGLSVASHTFRVRAIDAAGNVDPTPAEHTWTVQGDTTPPQTTIGSAPPATTTSTSASFAFSSSEAGSSFECSLDGAAFAACTSPHAISGLTVASHTFSVRAIDPAGNVDASPATHGWTVQAVPACSAGTVTVGANADSWMLQSSANKNYGTDSVLKVDSKNGNNARAIVRFNLPAVPSGCEVTGATLRLYASSYKNGRTLQALRVNASWTESNVRWNNQPATTGAAATTSSGSGYRQWSVADQVAAMYSGSNHGFLIRDATENNGGQEQGFHSREKGTDNPPQLVITFG